MSGINRGDNLSACIFMMLSMAGFALNDSIVKSIGDELTTGQVMLVRGLVASTLLFTLIRRQQRTRQTSSLQWNAVAHPLVALRGLFDILATLAFLTALMHLPFANLMALLQALPLVVTAGAALFYGEKVGWRRWVAIAIGFVGVLIIVRPGMEGFTIFSVLGLLAVLASASRDLATRGIPKRVASVVVTFVTSLMVTCAGAFTVITLDGWNAMSTVHVLKLSAAGLFVSVGYHFVILAMRVGEISFIAPFRYTGMLWAIGLGYWFFEEIPDLATLAGSALVIITGMYAFYRERRLSK